LQIDDMFSCFSIHVVNIKLSLRKNGWPPRVWQSCFCRYQQSRTWMSGFS